MSTGGDFDDILMKMVVDATLVVETKHLLENHRLSKKILSGGYRLRPAACGCAWLRSELCHSLGHFGEMMAQGKEYAKSWGLTNLHSHVVILILWI